MIKNLQKQIQQLIRSHVIHEHGAKKWRERERKKTLKQIPF